MYFCSLIISNIMTPVINLHLKTHLLHLPFKDIKFRNNPIHQQTLSGFWYLVLCLPLNIILHQGSCLSWWCLMKQLCTANTSKVHVKGMVFLLVSRWFSGVEKYFSSSQTRLLGTVIMRLSDQSVLV